MQYEIITRPRPKQTVDHSVAEEEPGGATLAQVSAIAQVARDAVQACKVPDAQKELDRRRNEPGQ